MSDVRCECGRKRGRVHRDRCFCDTYPSMTRHCSTCTCPDDERPPQPSASNSWARQAALKAAEQAVRDAKAKRGAKFGGDV